MINKQEARDSALNFLQAQNVGVVATVDTSGQPTVSPVYFATKKDFTIYFLTSSSTQKHKNIVENDKVGFSAGFGPDYTSIEMQGRAVIVNGIEVVESLALIAKVQLRVPMANWPITMIESFKKADLMIYKIIPEHVSFLNIDLGKHPESIADFVYQIVL
jgi:uncharacterized pyridoxamine 5'-phosphate oxidase family protein